MEAITTLVQYKPSTDAEKEAAAYSDSAYLAFHQEYTDSRIEAARKIAEIKCQEMVKLAEAEHKDRLNAVEDDSLSKELERKAQLAIQKKHLYVAQCEEREARQRLDSLPAHEDEEGRPPPEIVPRAKTLEQRIMRYCDGLCQRKKIELEKVSKLVIPDLLSTFDSSSRGYLAKVKRALQKRLLEGCDASELEAVATLSYGKSKIEQLISQLGSS